MTPEFLSIGYIVRDLIKGREQAGGSALYCAKTAKALGFQSSIITSADPDYPPLDVADGLKIVRTCSESTTAFIHHYEQPSGRRISRCRSLAPSIDGLSLSSMFKDIPLVMVCPNWTEVGPEILELFHTEFIALSPQGWFRDFDQEGYLHFRKSCWSHLPRKVKLIVLSEEDLSQDFNAWTWIKSSAEVAIRTRGKKGYTLAMEDWEKDFLPPYVALEVDATGAGDVFSTVMLIGLYQGYSPEASAEMASIAASFCVEKKGIEGIPTLKEITERWEAYGQRLP